MKGKNEHKEARKDGSEQAHKVSGRNDYQDFKCFGQKWSLDHLEKEKLPNEIQGSKWKETLKK